MPQIKTQAEASVFIAAEFEWKPGNLLDLVLNPQTGAIQFGIELTLMPRKPTRDGNDWSRYRINEENLTDAAFIPKTYTITLERGIFLTEYDLLREKQIPSTPRYAARLSFDPSPYPTREEWKKPDFAPDAYKFWEWKQFCGYKIPRAD